MQKILLKQIKTIAKAISNDKEWKESLRGRKEEGKCKRSKMKEKQAIKSVKINNNNCEKRQQLQK